ncbi:MAG: hypothetical protein V4773_27400 [Verrucomicrobiota bacterium]
MSAAAAAELDRVKSADAHRLDVLEVRLDLHTQLRAWEQASGVGELLARLFPDYEGGWIGWAYALREMQHITEARAVLLEAEPKHGLKSAVLHFNLACYYALLGDVTVARQRLRRACQLDASFKQAAKDDPDLKSLWV